MISRNMTLILLWLLTLVIMIVVFSIYNVRLPSIYGVVNGILYSIDNPTAIIDGELLKEGDVRHGVKIVKIHKTIVEFEKNGKRWKQTVGARANRAWDEDDDEY